MGAVWGRLATEVFGCLNAALLSRFAFPMPFPLRRIARIAAASAAMGIIVAVLDNFVVDSGPLALVALVPAGVAVYAAAGWLLDIGDLRAVCGALGAKAAALEPLAARSRRRPRCDEAGRDQAMNSSRSTARRSIS